MMTPRSVEMGNKVYKLHVKVGARKEILELPPDSSLDILHQHIYRIFQIPESQQRLVCNGKPLNFSSNLTLKQARVGNGSKILVQTCDMYTSSQSTHNTTDSNQRDRNTVRNNGDCRNTGSSCPEAAVDDAASKLRDLEEIDTKALQLEQTVHNLGLEFNKLNELQKKEQCELSRLKKESVSAGELLIYCLGVS
ncbi:uncharacterized protein LOC111701738 isoform X2 [Eurytemora carolleeae]|uniref:uncharacterized protein LOC111701738 isoform X2 n=2 Tax=Eurytemora carolleeae TaxID=1294199 RepID=UPI000C784EE1|nr:uncharacterized protein LOC111701738 isoform X2 [Eurytemora carolleeae]|eukprot:XP_023328916.1 uncharacterized protein LOC111701738 isoform X2 [Eurytemora affinis]